MPVCVCARKSLSPYVRVYKNMSVSASVCKKEIKVFWEEIIRKRKPILRCRCYNGKVAIIILILVHGIGKLI